MHESTRQTELLKSGNEDWVLHFRVQGANAAQEEYQNNMDQLFANEKLI